MFKNKKKDAPETSLSVFRRRWRKFRTLKRGWYSFILLCTFYLISLASPLLINNEALIVKYQGEYHFPVFSDFIAAKDLGQRKLGAPHYRDLEKQYEEAGEGDWVLMPPYPFGPIENLLRDPELEGNPPHAPSSRHWMGTDNRARDVFARLVYGFRISITFALGVVLLSYLIGMIVGGILGFFGGRVDIYGQRFVEIWAGMPFLYTVIILAQFIPRTPTILALILALFSWVGISYYMRGEYYREKARDYVAAARAQGESNLAILFKQILPNALTPIISFAPFAIVGAITALVSLDFLGFGLPAPTPSWGELVNQGKDNIYNWHLIVAPLGALFVTLLMIVFIGEAIREAFDPKVFSRLR